MQRAPLMEGDPKRHKSEDPLRPAAIYPRSVATCPEVSKAVTSQTCFTARHYLMGRFRGRGAAGIGRGPRRRPGATGNGGWGAGDEVRRCAGGGRTGGSEVRRIAGSAIWRFVGHLG